MSARPHFSIAGIPVRVEPFFLIVAGLFGLRLETLDLIAIWMAVMLVSVLVHELGHAFALKLFGRRSAIVLHGFGGVTVSQDRRRMARAPSIIVSVAGSLTALLVLWLPARSMVGTDWFWDQGIHVRAALYFTAFANLWWSIANLLPIRPLDGGHVASELIGVPRARVLSIVLCAAAALWVFTQHPQQQFAGFFAILLGFLNYSEIRAERQGARSSAFDVEAPEAGPPPRGRRHLRSAPPAPPRHTSPMSPASEAEELPRIEQAAWAALGAGNGPRAAQLLARLQGRRDVDPFLAAAVALANDSDELALDLYERSWRERPQGPSQLVATAVLGRSSEAAVEVARRLVARRGGIEPAVTLQTHLHYAGAYRAAAAVGEVVASARPPSPAQTAFETACSWSRAGEVDRALTWLDRAADHGFRAPALVDGEPDLVPVRAHPRWSEVRARLA